MVLHYKGESRCFVFHVEHIQKVKDAIKTLDLEEYACMPLDWVSLWDGDHDDLVMTGKFELDVPKLIDMCGLSGIGIMINSVKGQIPWVS